MPPTRSCQHQRYATSLASCLVVLAVPAGVILEVIISKSMASLVLEVICEDVYTCSLQISWVYPVSFV